MNKLVSIVVPVYQAEKTLERCVTSIMNGTYQNVEVILIDDCSRDSSYEIGKTLEKQYNQVVCLHNEKNSGVSETRNKGLQYAHGDYLMFVDSDDWVEEDFVQCMIESVQEGCMPVCGYINHDEVKNGRADRFGWSEDLINKQIALKEGIMVLYQNRLMQMIWNKVFVVKTIRDFNLQFDSSIHCGEDFRFLLEYLDCSNISSFWFLNKYPYHYIRDNENSLATRFTEIALEEPMYNLRKMYELTGKNSEEIDSILTHERKQQLMQYAYAYMHDTSLTSSEKKRKVLELPLEDSRSVYRQLKILLLKERIRKRVSR